MLKQRRRNPTARFHVLLVWDAKDRVWVTHVPTLNGLSTYGDTREEALERTREAVLGYLQAAAIEGLEAPRGDAVAE